MFKTMTLYLALAVFSIGLAFKISTWFRYSIRRQQVHVLTEGIGGGQGHSGHLVQSSNIDPCKSIRSGMSFSKSESCGMTSAGG